MGTFTTDILESGNTFSNLVANSSYLIISSDGVMIDRAAGSVIGDMVEPAAASCELSYRNWGWNTWEMRQRIDSSVITYHTGDFVRVKFVAGYDEGLIIDKAFIGLAQTGINAISADSLTQLTFSGNTNGYAAANNSVYSDFVTFSIPEGRSLLVTAYFANGENDTMAENDSVPGWDHYYIQSDTAANAQVDIEDYTGPYSETSVGIGSIEVGYAAFNGNTSQISLSCLKKLNTSTPGYIGKTFAAPSIIDRVVVYGSSDSGLSTAVNVTLQLYGKTGTAPANSSDGTLLAQTSFVDDNYITASHHLVSNNKTTAWNHGWVTITPMATQANIHVAEIEFYYVFSGTASLSAHEIRIGNSTVNGIINSSMISIGDVTINSTFVSSVNVIATGSFVIGNWWWTDSLFQYGLSGNVSINSSSYSVGNTVVNSSTIQVNTIVVGNSSINASAIKVDSIVVGNSSVNGTANSIQLKIGNTVVNSTTIIVPSGNIGIGSVTSPMMKLHIEDPDAQILSYDTSSPISDLRPAWLFGSEAQLFRIKSTNTTSNPLSAAIIRFEIDANGNIYTPNTMSICDTTAIPAGGSGGTGYKLSSTGNFGIFFGSGAPTLSAAKGSLYLRSDGSNTTTRSYINTDGGTTWTHLVTGT